MITELKYFPVNWVDGMKISRRHFEQNEFFLHDALRDVSSLDLTSYNYGVLPLNDALNVQIICDYNQNIQAKVLSCRAIVPNGSRIELYNTIPLQLQTTLKAITEKFSMQTFVNQEFDLIVSINLFKRIPVGEPIVDEMPPRYPFTRPELQLSIMPSEAVNTDELSNGLIIGRIIYKNGELQPVTDYLPACTSVSSLFPMREWYAAFQNHLNLLETYTTKVFQKTRDKANRTDLSDSIGSFSEEILKEVSRYRFGFKWRIPQQAPIHMLETMMQPVQLVQTFLNCRPAKEREELLTYLGEWMDLVPGAFENQIKAVLQLEYDHTELGRVFAEVDAFYKTLVTVFFKLSQLEIIGKRKGQNVFIIEHQVNEQKNPEPYKNRWSPI
ncbi:hypothetical protein QNI16_36935 [Cytophagaceae bacterium YF14B1]|uniref:Type VI secretion system baseplate subunit TssK n=1 Tax=Xanthocytophaga flava TaxID=3048013 RepID=A0AAE3QVD4_9BACT|nr:hypothetical protein [Xanthocytophaga flavus]MDJ1486127.1 hypothetical protein [Xanthocytophaga flavus]